MLLHQPPVEPGDRVVLAVGVVVALLGAAALVAEEEHRHALAQQQRGQQVLDLPQADGFDAAACGGAFDAVVVAEVVVVAVAVPLAVGLVVLLVVADQVVEREAVVAR